MFDALSGRLQEIFKKLRGQGHLTPENVSAAAKEIRKALLEADVHYKVAKEFVEGVARRAAGQEVLASVTPGQQFVKVVHDEMVRLLGGESPPLAVGAPGAPAVWMMVGLQGAGKTTTSAKLARLAAGQGRKPLLVAADVKRPAAVEQLATLGRQIQVPVFARPALDPVGVCREGVAEAARAGHDTVILDTAGRLHIDDELMEELVRIAAATKPREVLWVLDAMAGQDAVNAAKAFGGKLSLTGVVLTKLDGDARGGAALSAKAVLGIPIRLAGTGEKLDRLEPFHPSRVASRILGMGDIVGLVEKVQATVDLEKAKKMEEKLRKAEIDFDMMLEQMEQMGRFGSLKELLGMLPGMSGAMSGMDIDEKQVARTKAIIQSMTAKERRTPDLIDGSRRRRIAAGSGTSVQEVNALLRQFADMKRMMKGAGAGKLPRGLRGMKLPRFPGMP